MTTRNIADLTAAKNLDLPDNGTGNITPAVSRGQQQDIIDSSLNKASGNPEQDVESSVNFTGGIKQNGAAGEFLTDGAQDIEGEKTFKNGVVIESGGLDIGGTTAVDEILDEDNLSSDSDTALATQQSIKAYVDASVTSPPIIKQIIRKNITSTASTTTTLTEATTPTSTSGIAFDSLAITLTVANEVRIQVNIPIDGDNDNTIAVMIVSRGTTVVGVGSMNADKKNKAGCTLVIDMYDTPGIGAHTYNFRVATTINTAYFNEGSGTTNPWGGAFYRKNATITLTELI